MVRKLIKIMLLVILMLGMGISGVKAEEKSLLYEIQCTEPDGEDGYYKKFPEILVKRLMDNVVIKYRLEFENESILEGTMSPMETELKVPLELLQNGHHALFVWAENEKGVIKESETKKILRVDGQMSEDIQFIYQKDEESPVCFSEETVVELKANDVISGIDGIYYQVGETEWQYMKGNHVFVFVPLEFQGTIKAYAVDKAGNIGKNCESKTIICENRIPEVVWNSSEDLEGWHNSNFLLEATISESGVASGIKNVKWYLNGTLLGEKDGTKDTFQEKISIVTEGNCELEVRAEDYAGNCVTKKERLLFDNQNPTIEVEGVENYLISAEERRFMIRVQDDKNIDKIRGEMLYENMKGDKDSELISDWIRDGEMYVHEGVLKQDGIYQLSIEVSDRAGNTKTQKLQVIIDKTNPVIHQVETWNGKYFQVFEWKHRMEDLVSDLTSYTYQLKLDGKNFFEGEKCTAEGKHILEVEVEDAAGNSSSTMAEFYVDHTAPVVILEGAENGKTYEEKAMLKIRLEGEGFTEVKINGERYGENSHYLLEEPGEYLVEVEAYDLAGNITQKEIQFHVKEKQTLLEKIIDRDEKTEAEFVENKKENTFEWKWILIGGCSIGLVTLASFCVIKRKKLS